MAFHLSKDALGTDSAVAVSAGLRADTGHGSTQKSHPPKDGEQEIVSGAPSQADTMTLGRRDGQSCTEHPRIS